MSYEMRNHPIGIFDSGLGGLTAMKELETLLPDESIVYFGDTGRVPYGTRSSEIINQYAAQDIRFLKSQNIKVVLAACGTISSVARDVGKTCGLPFFDVLHATVQAAIRATKNGRIGVIATPATIASGSYRQEILKLRPELQVFEQPCPMFVPLVENGYISPHDEVTNLVVQRSLSPIRAKNIDTLILGCTHFPIIAPIISSVIGKDITLVNSGKEAALALSSYLRENDLLKAEGVPTTKSFYVSDTTEIFSNVAEIFLGHTVSGTTHRINIESY